MPHLWGLRRSCTRAPRVQPLASQASVTLVNNPNIYWLTQIKLPAVEPKPPVPPSVIRISNPMPTPLQTNSKEQTK